MFRRYLIASIVALAAIAAPADAQAILGLTGGYDIPGMERSERIDQNARVELLALQKTGVDALQSRNYPVAERAFGELLRQDSKNPDVNFLMGLTQIGLAKWTDA